MILLLTCILLLAASGISKAVKDTLSDHYSTSIFNRFDPKFWDKSVSSVNKYKDQLNDDLSPKFIGSTTFLVWTTDAWHLFDTIQSTCWQIALSLYIMDNNALPIWYIPIIVSCIKLCVSLPFELFYSKILIRK